jgi:hypothetical protein
MVSRVAEPGERVCRSVEMGNLEVCEPPDIKLARAHTMPVLT